MDVGRFATSRDAFETRQCQGESYADGYGFGWGRAIGQGLAYSFGMGYGDTEPRSLREHAVGNHGFGLSCPDGVGTGDGKGACQNPVDFHYCVVLRR